MVHFFWRIELHSLPLLLSRLVVILLACLTWVISGWLNIPRCVGNIWEFCSKLYYVSSGRSSPNSPAGEWSPCLVLFASYQSSRLTMSGNVCDLLRLLYTL